MMKIGIGNDHTAVRMKNMLTAYLTGQGYEVIDYGTDTEEICDYPVYGEKVSRAVAGGEVGKGILLCGSGIGMSMVANKVHGIRAALCSEPYSARLSRQHNDANVLVMGARLIGDEMAKEITDTWLATDFLGGRHQRRIGEMMKLEDE